jgi:choline dehydrogenase-like flavoprotein
LKKYDYIIVGSGAAATVLAKKILEKNPLTHLLMLEAGDKIGFKERRHWWDYVTCATSPLPYQYTYDTPEENQSTRDDKGNPMWTNSGGRVKSFGGSTMHWGGWALRFKPEDFQLYTNTGEGADWPISYNDIEPYYAQAEQYMSVCGDETEDWQPRSTGYTVPPFEWTAADGNMIQAFEQLDIQPGKMPVARYKRCMTTGTCKYCPYGARFSAQYVLQDLVEVPRYKNFEVKTQSVVTRVITSSKSQIDGVEFVHNQTDEKFVVHANKVILCAGAYEIPKLLMASTSDDWKNGIGNDSDMVGRHIVTHSMLEVTGAAKSNPHGLWQEYDFPTLMSRTFDTEEMQKHGKLFLFKDRTRPKVDIAQLMIEGKTKREINKIIRGPTEYKIQAFMEEVGRFENRISIGEGKDRFGLPLTKIEYSKNPNDDKRTDKHMELLIKIIETMGLKVVKTFKQTPRGDHTTGTCRMSATADTGVVDKNLKVHNTNNLYICSNGVFASNSAVNPTLTLTALAHRLADHLNHTIESKNV